MKRTWLVAVTACVVAISGITTTANAAVKTGSRCSAVGATAIVAGYKFKCMKSGKSLSWGKATKIAITSSDNSLTSPSPSPSPVVTPSPPVSPKPSASPKTSSSPSPYATLDTSKIIASPSPTSVSTTQLIPKLTFLTKTFNSFTFQIENYDSTFNWRIQPSDGYASQDVNGKVTVTGLKPSKIISVRVTASRAQYTDGFETIAVETSPESDALVPKLSILGETSSEFYVKIENFDSKFVWNLETTKGTAEEKQPGLYRIYNFGSAVDPVLITVNSSRDGFKAGQSIAIKNGTPTPAPSPTASTPPLAPTYSVSGIAVNKTAITTGQSITVSFNLATTNLSAFPQPLTVLFGNLNDDQYLGGEPATLVSGDITSGRYTATVSLPTITPGGTYPVYVFIKGFLSVTGPSVTLTAP